LLKLFIDERSCDLSSDAGAANERAGGGGGGGADINVVGRGGGGGAGAAELLLDVINDCCDVLGFAIDDDETGEVDERFSNCCDELRFDLNEVEDADGLVGA